MFSLQAYIDDEMSPIKTSLIEGSFVNKDYLANGCSNLESAEDLRKAEESMNGFQQWVNK